MKLSKPFFRLGMGPLLVGLALLLTLGGCLDIRIKSNLGDCPTVTTQDDENEPGACYKITWNGGDAEGFKNMVTGQIIPANSGLKCNTSGIQKKCKSNPGKCGLGSSAPPCYSQYSPTSATTGNCKCDC